MGIRTARLIAASTLLALACSDTAPSTPPVTDRFFYPTGLAIRHVPAGCTGGADGCQTQLFVVSSNFDLRYDTATGGTVVAVDVGQAIQAPLAPLTAPALIGVSRIGSFGGEVAILDGSTCPGYTGTPQALVASRSQNILYRLGLDAGNSTQVPLESTFGDPYGVTVACGTFGQLAFVTYLRTPNSEGQLSRIDLANGNARTQIDLGSSASPSVAPARSTVFDAFSSRLYVTELFGKAAFSPLRWLSLVATESPAPSTDLYTVVRGAEVRGIALSSDTVPPGTVGVTPHGPTRAYLAIRIYDVESATSTGLRPITDVGGALAVMDITPDSSGQPAARLLNLVPIDRGASEIRVIPRSGLRDLVAVTCTDDSTLTLYDDDTGAVAKVFDVCQGAPGEPAPCALGTPLTGKQPFGLAVEPLQGGHARLYVGSFDRWWVNVIEIDPSKPSDTPVSWVRIGPERQ